MQPSARPAIVQRVSSRMFCPVCGDVMGVYEPLLAVSRLGSRITSLGREPLLRSSDELIVHLACGSDRSGDEEGAPATAAPYEES